MDMYIVYSDYNVYLDDENQHYSLPFPETTKHFRGQTDSS